MDARSEADFERGHFAGAVLPSSATVLVFAEQELPLKSRALQVYGAKPSDEAAQQTTEEFLKLGFESVEVAPFGFDEATDNFQIKIGFVRWKVLGCGG